MYWVYILRSKIEEKFYVGSTADLRRRLTEHNNGLSRSTKRYRPWVLVYTEGYASPIDALTREKNLKYFGKAYAQLKRRAMHSLQDGLKGAG